MSSFTLAWHFLIFGVLPYVVIAVLILGSLALCSGALQLEKPEQRNIG